MGWAYYGGDQGGTRFSGAREITPRNVDDLRVQWIYRTGDLAVRDPAVMASLKFETTPILVGDSLVLCSPFSEVIALDPGTGAQRWRFDPTVRTDLRPGNRYNCRGVAYWRDPAAADGAACATRIFVGTVDARLIAVDARTGARCTAFGRGGDVAFDPGPLRWPGELQVASAPVVAGDVVIVGSAINDNGRVDTPSGKVRAYDARTGAPRWTWDPIPRNASDPAAATWGDGWRTTGAANVWAPMSVDDARGLVFLPTSSGSPDFYGGHRPGANLYSDSVVALRARDGTLAWAFQVVKHDVWDYDLPAQPTLATLNIGGAPRDVVIQATKQGFVFVLDRDTGQPVFPVEERAVPQGGAPGDVLSPTQTFPADLPPLVPTTIKPGDAYGLTFYDRGVCRDRIAAARSEGLYTPPSTQGTLLFPFTGGGANWGGVAVDPRGIVFVNTSRAIHKVTLIPRDDFERERAAHPGKESSPQTGTPFGMRREVLLSPLGLPCNPPPWGTLAALDLNSKRIVWEAPLGTIEEFHPLGVARATGTPNFGGPVVTAGGLVFIGAALDRYLRAFDAATGQLLWTGRLPAAGVATPMTYTWQGRQYVVIAAGGHGQAGSKTGDAIVAFALPRDGEARRTLWDRTIDRPGGRFAAGAALTTLALVALVVAGVRWRSRRTTRR